MNLSDIDKLTYEQAISELDEIVQQLESGKAPLEKSVELYQRGVALSKHCESLLSKAESKVMILTDNNFGEKQEEAFTLSGSDAEEEH